MMRPTLRQLAEAIVNTVLVAGAATLTLVLIAAVAAVTAGVLMAVERLLQ